MKMCGGLAIHQRIRCFRLTAPLGSQVASLSTCLSNFDRADFELAWCLLIWPGVRLVFRPCQALSGAMLSGQARPLSSLLDSLVWPDRFDWATFWTDPARQVSRSA
ncbi:unnamed protein product [Lupinus luteus]|uniref:Uncharacterized protein n=1 Tax=Lupinus luteus TaxID=3873 RepID=A0AAV1WJH6_LUPLU